jgi:hypothetical protein
VLGRVSDASLSRCDFLNPFHRRSVQVMVSRPLGRLRRPRLRPATPRHRHLAGPASRCVAGGLRQCWARPDPVVRLDLGSHVSGGLSARSVRPLSPFHGRSGQVMVSRPLGRLRRPRFTPGHTPTPSPAPTSGPVRRSRHLCRAPDGHPFTVGWRLPVRGVRHAAARPAVRRCSRRARRSSREPGRGRTGARSH